MEEERRAESGTSEHNGRTKVWPPTSDTVTLRAQEPGTGAKAGDNCWTSARVSASAASMADCAREPSLAALWTAVVPRTWLCVASVSPHRARGHTSGLRAGCDGNEAVS